MALLTPTLAWSFPSLDESEDEESEPVDDDWFVELFERLSEAASLFVTGRPAAASLPPDLQLFSEAADSFDEEPDDEPSDDDDDDRDPSESLLVSGDTTATQRY